MLFLFSQFQKYNIRTLLDKLVFTKPRFSGGNILDTWLEPIVHFYICTIWLFNLVYEPEHNKRINNLHKICITTEQISKYNLMLDCKIILNDKKNETNKSKSHIYKHDVKKRIRTEITA